MYAELPIESLSPNPDIPNRISRRYYKRLLLNINKSGLYETLIARPHPQIKGKFEIINGNVRLHVLEELGFHSVKCDIWDVDDNRAKVLWATLNKLRGSDVPELRMKLLFELLDHYSTKGLAARLPETVKYLEQLQNLREGFEKDKEEDIPQKQDVVFLQFYLSPGQHNMVMIAIEDIIGRFKLTDSSQALVKLAEFYLTRDQGMKASSSINYFRNI